MERRDIVIIGAGGFGREVMWQLSEVNHSAGQYNIMGFVDDAPELRGKLVNGFPVVGGISWLADYQKEISAAVCVGNPITRKNIYERIKYNSFINYPTIIAGDVKYSPLVKFGRGCIVCLSGVLTVNIAIGDFVIINYDCTIGHDVILEDFVTLYPSVNVSGNVHIGTCTEIGTGVNIIQGRNIGSNTVIGAGSAVVRDIPSDCVAVGMPAMPVKSN